MPRALPHISCSRAFTSIAAFPRFYLLYATPHCPVCLVVKVVVSHKVDYKYYRVWRVWIGKGDDFDGWLMDVVSNLRLFEITSKESYVPVISLKYLAVTGHFYLFIYLTYCTVWIYLECSLDNSTDVEHVHERWDQDSCTKGIFLCNFLRMEFILTVTGK